MLWWELFNETINKWICPFEKYPEINFEKLKDIRLLQSTKYSL